MMKVFLFFIKIAVDKRVNAAYDSIEDAKHMLVYAVSGIKKVMHDAVGNRKERTSVTRSYSLL